MDLTRNPLPLRWLDRLGAGISLGCGLHCAGLTAILMLNPALWMQLARQGNALRWLFWLEIGLLASAVLLAVAAFALGWRRHRHLMPILLAIPGLTALLLGVLSGLHDLRFIGSGLAIAGGVLMILAHWLNSRACASRGDTPSR